MILGLDISTSCTGYCILDADNEVIRAAAWETKKKTVYDNVFQKAQFIKENMCEMKAQYPVEKIFIEKPFMFFGSGGSTAKTMSILQRFNGIVSWLCYDIFDKTPQYLTVQQARKLNKITINKGKDTKKQIIEWTLDNTPSFMVELTRYGNPQSKYYDMADAIIVAKAGLIKLNETTK